MTNFPNIHSPKNQNIVGDPFTTLVKGLSSKNLAARLSAVHYAFAVMDDCIALDIPGSTSLLDSLLDIVNVQLYTEPSINADLKPANLRPKITESILTLLGKRLSLPDDFVYSPPQTNVTKSIHNFYPVQALTLPIPPSVSFLAAGLDLNYVRLGGLNLSGMNFTQSSFSYSILTDINFRYCCLKGCSLQNAEIKADISHSDFTNSDVSFGKLSAVSMKTDYRGTSFNNTECCFTKTTEARFEECDFSNASLEYSDQWINLEGSFVNSNTILPDGRPVSDFISSTNLKDIETQWGRLHLN